MSAPRTGFHEPAPDPVSARFARIESIGARLGLAFTTIAYALYVTGVVKPLLTPQRLLHSLGGPAASLARETALPAGWAWLGYVNHGDVLTLAALVVLALVVLAGYVSLLPTLLRRRDVIYVVLVALQIGVFVFVAAGWSNAPH